MRREDFTVGWICALDFELTASRGMLDKEYPASDLNFGEQDSNDSNSYTYGRIGGHHIVLTCLPAGKYGTESAAVTANSLLHSFPNIRFGLMVGIGGGVPSDEPAPSSDIRLGDVVVSQPSGDSGGVVQYDLGKILPGGMFQRRGSLNKPPHVLLGAVQKLKSDHELNGPRILENLDGFYRKLKVARVRAQFQRPPLETDSLHLTECQHLSDQTCDLCGTHEEFRRDSRIDDAGEPDTCPAVHYGLIASGNRVTASIEERERLRKDLPILCFEMEAAGLMDSFPCLVIRGISDYADSYKRDQWQKYAAASAAAYAKELLESVQTHAVTATARAQEVTKETSVLQLLSSAYQDDKNAVRRRVKGTCEWFLKNPTFLDWRNDEKSSLLWLTAGPGCGKSVLSRTILEEGHLDTSSSTRVCYFFFKDGLEGRMDGTDAISALLHQLYSGPGVPLISKALPAYESHGKLLRKNLSELWNILIDSTFATESSQVICVLDALDECKREARVALQDLLEDFFGRASHKPGIQNARLKFLITSRPYHDVEYHFRSLLDAGTCINLDGNLYANDVAHDINLVIDDEVPQMLRDSPESTKTSVTEKLKSVKHRTYLWLYLTLDILRRRLSDFVYDEDFDEILDTLPLGIQDAYGKLLESVGRVPRARNIISIVLAARRTLNLNEMNIALAISERKQAPTSMKELQLLPAQSIKGVLENTCGLLVQVFDSKVYLIHQTAREYLLRKDGDSEHPWKETFDGLAAHAFLCTLCLKQLLMDEVPAWDLDFTFTADNYDDPKLEFFFYGVVHWREHWNRLTTTIREPLLEIIVALFSAPKSHGHHFKGQTASLLERLRSQRQPFYVAAREDMYEVLEYMLENIAHEEQYSALLECLIVDAVALWGRSGDEERSFKTLDLILDKTAQRADVDYLRDWALDQALVEGITSTIDLALWHGGHLSLWNLRLAHSLSGEYTIFTLWIKRQSEFQLRDLQTILVSAPGSNLEQPSESCESHNERFVLRLQQGLPLNNSSGLPVVFKSSPDDYSPRRMPYTASMVDNGAVDSNDKQKVCLTRLSGEARFEVPIRACVDDRLLFISHVYIAMDVAAIRGWFSIITWLLDVHFQRISNPRLRSIFALAVENGRVDCAGAIFRRDPSFFKVSCLEILGKAARGVGTEENKEAISILMDLHPSISEVDLMTILRSVQTWSKNDCYVILGKTALYRPETFRSIFLHLFDEGSRVLGNADAKMRSLLEVSQDKDVEIDKATMLRKSCAHHRQNNDLGLKLFKRIATSIGSFVLPIQILAQELRLYRDPKDRARVSQLLEAINARQDDLYEAGFEKELQRLDRGDDTTSSGKITSEVAATIKYEMLCAAAQGGNSKLVNYLLSLNFCPNQPAGYADCAPFKYTAPLQTAISTQSKSMVEVLLDAGADATCYSDGISACFAIALDEWHNSKVAVKLLQQGADPNAPLKEGRNALARAVQDTRIGAEVTDLMLQKGALSSVQPDGENTVQVAMLDRQFDLILQGVPTPKSESGRLQDLDGGFYDKFVFAHRGTLQLAGLLRSWNVIPDATCETMGSALCVAAYCGFTPVVNRMLQSKEVTVDAAAGIFGTALCAAAFAGYADIVQLLLMEGAEVNRRGRQGTALEHARQEVKDLGFPRDPLSKASKHKHKGDNKQVVSLLLNWGAKTSAEAARDPSTLDLRLDELMDGNDFYESDEVEDWMDADDELGSDVDDELGGDVEVVDDGRISE